MEFPDRIGLADWGFREWTLIWSNWDGIYTEKFTFPRFLETRLFEIMCREHWDDSGFTLISIHYGYNYKIKEE